MSIKRIEHETVVIGAGLIGSSAAMHLAQLGASDVIVIDFDLEGNFSSSELNAGGVRATWLHPLNAAISKASIEYYEKIATEIGFRQRGYFWMHDEGKWPTARSKIEANTHLKDAGIEYLDPGAIRAKFPFLDKLDGVGGATFSPRDGLLNPNLLKLHYRAKARGAGIDFIDRILVTGIVEEGSKVRISATKFAPTLSHDEIRNVLTGGEPADCSAEKIEIICSRLVHCTGAWAKSFAAMIGHETPVKPVRRQVSIFECRGLDLTPYGMFVDTSGVYFHPEADMILAGFAIESEPAGLNLEYDGTSFFEKYIWPPLYERSTKFESLKHVTGWGGLYEVSPDNSAVIGRVPNTRYMFEAHSFSGRGAMQSYAAGRAVAELAFNGFYESLDLSALGAERFASGQLVTEGLLI